MYTESMWTLHTSLSTNTSCHQAHRYTCSELVTINNYKSNNTFMSLVQNNFSVYEIENWGYLLTKWHYSRGFSYTITCTVKYIQLVYDGISRFSDFCRRVPTSVCASYSTKLFHWIIGTCIQWQIQDSLKEGGRHNLCVQKFWPRSPKSWTMHQIVFGNQKIWHHFVSSFCC